MINFKNFDNTKKPSTSSFEVNGIFELLKSIGPYTNGDKLKKEKKSFGKQKMNKYETASSKDKRVFKLNNKQFYLKRKTLKRTKNR